LRNGQRAETGQAVLWRRRALVVHVSHVSLTVAGMARIAKVWPARLLSVQSAPAPLCSGKPRPHARAGRLCRDCSC
jgi:hypothetical protein